MVAEELSKIVTCRGNWDFTYPELPLLLCGNLLFFLFFLFLSFYIENTLVLEAVRKEVVVITMCFIDEQNCEGVKMEPLDVDPCS